MSADGEDVPPARQCAVCEREAVDPSRDGGLCEAHLSGTGAADDDAPPDPETCRAALAERFEAAGVRADRVVDVVDGEKKCVNHTQRPHDAVSGNYGVYAGDGLVLVDVDHADAAGAEALDDLPATLTVESPHARDEREGHHLYRVEDADAYVDEWRALDTGDERQSDVWAALVVTLGTGNPEPEWGEVRAGNMYVVGPGSQLDGCSKDWCDACAEPDGGYYRLDADRDVATVTVEALADAIRPGLDDGAAAGGDTDAESGASSAAAGAATLDEYQHTDAAADDERDDWAREHAAEMLKHIDPDVDYPEWRNIGYALVSLCETRSRAKSLFMDWSKQGSEWDDDAPRLAKNIIDDASPNGGVTPATLVETARRGGWSLPDGIVEGGRDVADGGDRVDHGSVLTWTDVRTLFADSDTTRGRTLKAAADLLCERETFATMNDTEDIYRYNPETGIYEPDGEQYVGSALESGLGEHYGGSVRREVLTRIRDRTWTDRDTFGGSRADPKVCVGNGVLDIETLELYDHNPDREFIRRIPWDWPAEDDAEPEAFDEFLGDVVGDEESKQTIYEVLGLAIHPGYLKAGFLLLYGDGRNGKSTLLEAVECVLDPANVSSRTMRDLVSDNHAKASLYGKMANICGETGSDKLPNTAALKELTGGDSVTANPKNKQPFTFHNEAVLMFLANDPPEIDDDSTALARRLLLVNCPNEFTPEGEPGPDLRPKQELLADIASPEECQAILRRAVEAVRRIRETGSFGHSQSVEEVRERYNRISDPVYAFQEAAIAHSSEGFVPTSDLYNAYKAWCEANDAPVKDKGVFIKKLQKHVRMNKQRKRRDGDRVNCYAGISLTSDAAALLVEREQSSLET